MGARDDLLTTKLHVPRPRPDFVARPRLTARLDQGLARTLTLVCAPAGFGKTSLLAAWAGAGRQPVAWLSLDEGDNDPARFWRHVAAALDRARPGLSDRVGPLLGSPAPRSFEGVVTALINELAAENEHRQALLVLDDYHLIRSEPVHTAVDYLLGHRPPGLRVVISTRSDPPLRLSRLRARGELAELRAADLRFSDAEAALLLGTAAGRLTSTAVTALTARTEGWAAGLKLAGLSLQSQDDVEKFVAAFSGSHRYVLDYLAEEVLDRQDPPVRAFLLQTSVLERLSGDLCDAVTGHPGGQAMLERIERTGLFLVPLDEVRGWWRYHQLFADLLLMRLQAEHPGRAAALHRAAAAWHAERGLADDAVRHAIAAGDPELAAQQIEQHFDAAYFTGENGTLNRWLADLPDDLVNRRPRLSLARAIMALTEGDPAAAQAAVAALETEPGPDGDSSPDTEPGPDGDSFLPSAGAAASLIVNVPAGTAIARSWLAYLRGDARPMTELAAEARARLRDGEWILGSICRLNVALADWLSGRLGDARRELTAATAGWQAAGQPALAAQGCRFLGQIHSAQGNLDAALDAYRELLQATATLAREHPAAGIGHVGTAEVRYQRGDLAGARQALAAGLPLCRRITEPQALGAGLAILAWVRQAEGDPAGAREAMDEAERVGPSPAVTPLLNPVPAERARLLLAQGDVAAAAAWTARRGLDLRDEPAYPRERDYLVLARVLIAQNRPAQALGLLDRWLDTAQAQGRGGSVIEIRALRALALARGDEPAAVAELATALALAGPQDYVRVFADEGAPMAALLSQVHQAQREGHPVAAQVPLAQLAAVLRASAPPGDQAASATPGLIEPLTPRETQVLELLAAGAPNQRIADELVVTLDTVKKHVTHVLGKLGAANRTEAVSRARQLGLISD